MKVKTDKEYWDNRWENQETGWDVGYASFPLKDFIDSLEQKDRRILIPGCGNGYEGEYLFKKGFSQVYLLDISPLPLENFQKRVPDFPKEHLLNADFFKLEQQFDLILEQTFFCAIDPDLRKNYVHKMFELLNPGGKVAGLLFNDPLNTDHPPFGGSEKEYRELFSPYFEIVKMETAKNSIEPRKDRELFFELKKRSNPYL